MSGPAAGFALGIFVYPYLFLADIVATERVENQAARKVVASGMFIHANPGDPIHHGKGKVTVYEDLVHLDSGFAEIPVTNRHDAKRTLFDATGSELAGRRTKS